MRVAIIGFMLVGLVGCSGMENIVHKEGNHFKNWRVKYSSHPFSPSVERDYNETCPPLETDPKKPDLENCVPDSTITADGVTRLPYEMAKEGGWASGFSAPIINGAAFVGGMYAGFSALRPAHTSNNFNSNNNASFYDNIPPSGGHALVK